MTESELQRLLDEVSTGSTGTGTAATRILDALRAAPFVDLGFARVDHHRHLRQGFPEVVLGLGKTPAQIASISERIVSAGHSLLVTRTTLEVFDAVRDVVPNATFHGEARAITLAQGEILRGHGTILVACAGTSDLHDRLQRARVLIVVAGMEGALPSVVGGLVRVPVIAVPTSVGYGASFGGIAALLGMLNSCASGVCVVNIDNGFGAACVASRINHL